MCAISIAIVYVIIMYDLTKYHIKGYYVKYTRSPKYTHRISFGHWLNFLSYIKYTHNKEHKTSIGTIGTDSLGYIYLFVHTNTYEHVIK